MKKNWISYVFMFTAFILIGTGSVIAVASQETGFNIDPSSYPERKERKPIIWRVAKSENEIARSFDAPNGIGLVKSAVAHNQTVFVGEKGKYNFQIETNEVIPTSRLSSEFYGTLGFSAGRRFRSVDISAHVKYYRSQFASFAILGGEVSKKFEFNDDKSELKPFTNFGWYAPTETHYSNNSLGYSSGINPGFVWRNGIDFSTKKFGKMELNFIGQFIADSGAIQAGDRMAINAEATCIMPPFYGFRMGPRISYTHFIFPSMGNRLIKPNKLNFGLVFKII